MSGEESVIPRGCSESSFESDRVIEIGSDLVRSSHLLIGDGEPPVIAGGEVEASEVEDQAGDEGDDVGVDGGHRAD